MTNLKSIKAVYAEIKAARSRGEITLVCSRCGFAAHSATPYAPHTGCAGWPPAMVKFLAEARDRHNYPILAGLQPPKGKEVGVFRPVPIK